MIRQENAVKQHNQEADESDQGKTCKKKLQGDGHIAQASILHSKALKLR